MPPLCLGDGVAVMRGARGANIGRMPRGGICADVLFRQHNTLGLVELAWVGKTDGAVERNCAKNRLEAYDPEATMCRRDRSGRMQSAGNSSVALRCVERPSFRILTVDRTVTKSFARYHHGRLRLSIIGKSAWYSDGPATRLAVQIVDMAGFFFTISFSICIRIGPADRRNVAGLSHRTGEVKKSLQEARCKSKFVSKRC